jgi:MFS family permease
MPLRILSVRGLVGSSVVRGFLVTGMYSTFFLGTLYLEHIRHLSALDTGLAYMPWTVTVAIMSLGVTSRLVARFGGMRVLVGGMVAVIAGLLLLTTTGPHTAFFPTIGVAFFLIGLGIGTAFMPLLQIAMANVPSADAGLGSGIVNVSQQISGALGLAVLSTIATNHTKTLATGGSSVTDALIGGYHLAFTIGAVAVAVGIGVALVVLRTRPEAASVAAAPTRAPALDAVPADGPAFENLALDLLDPDLAAVLDAESDNEHDFGLPFGFDETTIGADVEGY